MRMKTTAITELAPSPDDERRTRMIRYAIAMGIRMVCLVLVIVIPDWWRLIPAIGAIALPYFAVVIANNVSGRVGLAVSRPGSIVPVRPAPLPEATPSPTAPDKDAA
jgi:MFS superfamily sulfate permease-like transporter